MPLNEQDPNRARSHSKSSNVSSSTRGLQQSSGLISNSTNMLSSGSGVLGMLRTTTETGDLGAFSVSSNRLPKFPKGFQSRNDGPPLTRVPSKASSHYSHYTRTASLRSKTSQHSFREHPMPGGWPYNHFPQTNGHNYDRARSDGRSSVAQDSIRSMTLGFGERQDSMGRSYSLTNTINFPNNLSNHRSLTSLRSQGQMSRPQSPYGVPNRLRKPQSRPASPALSDSAGLVYASRNRARHSPGPRAYTVTPLPPQRFQDIPYQTGYDGLPTQMRSDRTVEETRRPFVMNGIVPKLCRDGSPLSVNNMKPNRPYRFNANQGPPLPNFRQPTLQSARDDFVGDDRSIHNVSDTTNTAPYMGFVQRVKNVLEERISSEDMRRSPRPDEKRIVRSPQTEVIANTPMKISCDEPLQSDNPISFQSLQTSAPVIPARANSLNVKRLTRDLIKAGMDSCSDMFPDSDVASDSNPDIRCPVLFTTEVNRASTPFRGEDNEESKECSQTLEIETEDCEANAYSEVHNEQIGDSAETSETQENLRSSCHTILPNEEENRAKSGDHETTERSVDISPHPNGSKDHTDTRSLQNPSADMYNAMARDAIPTTITSPTATARETDQRVVKVQHYASGSDLTMVPNEAQAKDPSASTSRHSSVASMFPDSIASSTHLPAYGADEGNESNRNSSSVTNRRSAMPLPLNPRTAWPSRNESVRSSTASDNSDAFMSTACTTIPIPLHDTRSSAIRHFHFPLPDLTEDSQEDASTTNLRMLGAKPPVFRRGRKGFKSQNKLTSRVPATSIPPRSYLSNTLTDSHMIPSFNFSRVDLTTRLNLALNLRRSRSLTSLERIGWSASRPSTLERPMSSDIIRKGYASFFAPDEESTDEIDEFDKIDEEKCIGRRRERDELVGEINRLTIPSLNNLTLRLSELIPSIRKSRSLTGLSIFGEITENNVQVKDLNSLEQIANMEESIEFRKRISASAPETRRATPMSSASASRSRVGKGVLRLMKDLPPLPPDGNTEKLQPTTVQARDRPVISTKQSLQNIAELEATESAITKQRRDSAVELVKQSSEVVKPFTESEEPTKVPPGTPRPWYSEGSFPWTGDTPTLEIAGPLRRNSGRSSPVSKLRKRVGTSPRHLETEVDAGIRIARSMSPGRRGDTLLIPKSDGSKLEAKFENGQKGIFGSIARKIGGKHRVDMAGFPIDSIFLHPEDRATDPGDRYPTTGLTPPSGLTIEENRSFFSDDSSIHSTDNRTSVRKRLTRLHPRRIASRAMSPRQSGMNDSRNGLHSVSNLGGSVFTDSSEHDDRDPFLEQRPPAGMSKAEFRAKRMVEKLRLLWYKSGSAIRNFSKNKKQQQEPVWYETNHSVSDV